MEKDLTFEEMKSMVAMATVLPALLDKIDAINLKISELEKQFKIIQEKFNTNTIVVEKALDEMKVIESDILTVNKFSKENEKITNQIKSFINNQKQTQSSISTNKKNGQKSKKDDKQETGVVENIYNKIYKELESKKFLSKVTVQELKKNYNCSNEEAIKVINKFKEKGLYHEKSYTLQIKK